MCLLTALPSVVRLGTPHISSLTPLLWFSFWEGTHMCSKDHTGVLFNFRASNNKRGKRDDKVEITICVFINILYIYFYVYLLIICSFDQMFVFVRYLPLLYLLDIGWYGHSCAIYAVLNFWFKRYNIFFCFYFIMFIFLYLVR